MALHNNCSTSRSSLADNSSMSSYYTNDNSRSVSRDSSFSSYSTSSTTDSSGCSCDRIDSPLRGSSHKYDKQNSTKQDRLCSRLPISRRKLFALSREGGFTSGNQYMSNFHKVARSLDGNEFAITDSNSERSKSEPELSVAKSLLSTPEGLIISTPQAKTSPLVERARSRSESYEESAISTHSEEKSENHEQKSKLPKETKPKRRLNTSFDWQIDDKAMKRVLELLEGSKTKETTCKRGEDMQKRLDILTRERDSALRERDVAIRERDEALRDRDCYKCERNALQLERDNLIEQKEELMKELTNRSCVIDHLKEHLGLAYIPVNMDSYKTTPKTTTTPKHNLDIPSNMKIRPRSKSEVRPPEFFVPDEVFQKSNAYTRL